MSGTEVGAAVSGAALQVFCVPFAGGTARSYQDWQRWFPPNIEIVPLEAAGKGRRSAEPSPATLREAAADLAARVQAVRTGVPHVLFGHSLGALIAFEMTLAGADLGLPLPELLVVSGRNPPNAVSRWGAETVELPDHELLAALRTVGGVPEGLPDSIAARFFLPGLRADLRLAVGYRAAGDRPSDVPLLVLAGRQDPLVDHHQVADWARHTRRSCDLWRHDGHHFGLFRRPGEAARAITAALPRPVLAANRGATA
ncbi:thioesterase II family protein [Spirillospora sp. NPDC050679]